MDAIECGIVKLPRVPVADNIPGDDMPMYRNLWEHIRKKMPKKGRGKDKALDPLDTDGGADLPLAAAAARIAATDAYDFASKENIQTHGGIGFTWEADTQFHYRRARVMALALGGPMAWKDKLVSRLEQKNAA
jgi:alkylation response protein AidB-like acyl-CoA dehydrogenase